MHDKIEKALDKVRPYLHEDGGDVEIIEVTDDGIVKLKLTGTCGCCPMSQKNLLENVKKMLRAEVPQIKEVLIL